MTAIAVRGLAVSIDDATLLDGIDLDVASGEWISVLGPNGAGKSTLLRALAGVIGGNGSITFDGTPLTSLRVRDIARLVAWVPQAPEIPPGMRVFDYVLLGRTPHLHPLARERREDLARAEAVLDDLDLTELADRTVDSLSGGERQRTVIGRALAQDSPVLLLDEPTTALDLGHQQDALDLLARLHGDGGRTIISTMHDLTLAGHYADRLLMLSEGRIAATGTATDVLTEENISRYYRASVSVSSIDNTVVVAPKFKTTAKEPHGNRTDS